MTFAASEHQTKIKLIYSASADIENTVRGIVRVPDAGASNTRPAACDHSVLHPGIVFLADGKFQLSNLALSSFESSC
jgi:hypothetical protein